MPSDRTRIAPGETLRLADRDPASTHGIKGKNAGQNRLAEKRERIASLQELLYAEGRRSLLVIMQAMDTAGKDGVIRTVFSGVDPQGVHVTPFKAPTEEELEHDFLWRAKRALPRPGGIAVFNRSYYEEVLVVRVHPELLDRQTVGAELRGDALWQERFERIAAFERAVVGDATAIVKIFLHLSKDEQKRRLLARIDTPEKRWKASLGDVRERGHWEEYMAAYEEAIARTSTEEAPWHVVPADHKWYARAIVAHIVAGALAKLDPRAPVPGDEQRREIDEARRLLEEEGE